METAQLFIDRDWVVFTGRVDALESHQNPAHACLAGLDGPMTLADGGQAPAIWSLPAQSVPRVDARDTRLLQLLLAPHHPVARQAWALGRARGLQDPLPDAVAGCMKTMGTAISAGERAPESLIQRLSASLPGPPPEPLDSRVTAAIRQLRDCPQPPLDLAALEGVTGLAAPALRRLFRAQLGVSVGRFRVWARIQELVMVLGASQTITEAASRAGFRDPRQLARDFRMLFGLDASGVLRNAQPLAIRPRFDLQRATS